MIHRPFSDIPISNIHLLGLKHVESLFLTAHLDASKDLELTFQFLFRGVITSAGGTACIFQDLKTSTRLGVQVPVPAIKKGSLVGFIYHLVI
jgi:hypothetical protein